MRIILGIYGLVPRGSSFCHPWYNLSMADKKQIASWGKGSMEILKGAKILRLKGGPYERGFQHGHLLGSLMEYTIPRGMASAAAVCAKAIGSNQAEGLARIFEGARIAQPFIPESMAEEIRGMADALAAQGSKLDYGDLVAWNLMYDSWCFYAHPGYGNPGAETIGCSSFSAWGAATKDGRLIFGKNMDNLAEGRVLTICDPDEGLGYANITQAGMVAIDGGVNEAGIAMMTHYSGSSFETMRSCGIGVLSRQLLLNADSMEKAVAMLGGSPRCTGINYHVADAAARKAGVVEANARDWDLRLPWGGDFLWSTNHCNCYPGWMGYRGTNMVAAQAPVYGLKDISTAAAWQESLKEKGNPHIAAAGRFRRYEALLKEKYGILDLESAIEVLRDRQDPDSGLVRDWDQPAIARNDGMTISYLMPRKQYSDYVDWYKAPGGGPVTGQSMNLWSMVAELETGEFAAALTGKPGHKGEFIFLNLKRELERLRA
ncbi:MAG: hypothetical protein FD137_2051 [Spirochaetes bacterium]|nr:MAG: hypothetical protein FD137_2051 [Spirochaetota bacterium]